MSATLERSERVVSLSMAWEAQAEVPGGFAEEAGLVAGLRAGRRDAFEALHAAYAARIYNLALRIVDDSEEAQDVAQEVLLTVFRSLPGNETDLNLPAWLYRVTVNKAFDHIRARKRRPVTVVDEAAPEAQSAVDEYERAELSRRVEIHAARAPQATAARAGAARRQRPQRRGDGFGARTHQGIGGRPAVAGARQLPAGLPLRRGIADRTLRPGRQGARRRRRPRRARPALAARALQDVPRLPPRRRGVGRGPHRSRPPAAAGRAAGQAQPGRDAGGRPGRRHRRAGRAGRRGRGWIILLGRRRFRCGGVRGVRRRRRGRRYGGIRRRGRPPGRSRLGGRRQDRDPGRGGDGGRRCRRRGHAARAQRRPAHPRPRPRIPGRPAAAGQGVRAGADGSGQSPGERARQMRRAHASAGAGRTAAGADDRKGSRATDAGGAGSSAGAAGRTDKAGRAGGSVAGGSAGVAGGGSGRASGVGGSGSGSGAGEASGSGGGSGQVGDGSGSGKGGGQSGDTGGGSTGGMLSPE